MDLPIAILCSGQGTQHPGMFDLVAQAPESGPIFEAARVVLGGYDPRQIVREAGPETLFSNRNGQILCCTQALAAWAILHRHLPGPVVLAGYSVGELAAWGCAGLLEPSDLLRLAVTRAELMDETGGTDSGLEAIIGLGRPVVEALCRAHNAHIAIVNGQNSFIVGGVKDALNIIHDEAVKAGATRATTLRVAVASHTPLLADASRRYGDLLSHLRLPDRPPKGIRLLSGIDGETIFDIAEGREKLAAQISRTINWEACLDSCRAVAAETYLELGPGRALTNMARETLLQARIHSVEDFRSPAGLVAWLKA
jgi:[acyl-carrier-protein] S-malonyltransferase